MLSLWLLTQYAHWYGVVEHFKPSHSELYVIIDVSIPEDTDVKVVENPGIECMLLAEVGALLDHKCHRFISQSNHMFKDIS